MVQTDNNLMPGHTAHALLEEISTWHWVTTIIIHEGCVFEFKGPFPKGTTAQGFYNLEGGMPGFHGHLNLNNVSHIRFQDSPHRGRESYAFVFETKKNDVIFKIFLGRDEQDALLSDQVTRFKDLQQHHTGLTQ